MIKNITINIPEFDENLFFAPIRDKISYVHVILYSTRYLLLGNIASKSPSSSKFTLDIDKMSRLTFQKENKIFSISYPFTVIIDEGNINKIQTNSGIEIDFRLVSNALSVIENIDFRNQPSTSDFLFEFDDEGIDDGLKLVEYLFVCEPGYLRFDFDQENENGALHPLNHIDINYSDYASYKIGLKERIDYTKFIDILNIKTDCYYIAAIKN